MEKIKVLHINAGSGIFGGVSKICLDWYRNIDREKIQFDFLTPNRTTFSTYEDEINSYGGTVYELGINASSSIGKLKLWFALREFFKTHKYDVVHVNSGVLFFNCVVVSAAKTFTNATVFCHSHNNGGRSKSKEKFAWILKDSLTKKADRLMAVSDSAAAYMFAEKMAKDVIIINNGIDVAKFNYNEQIRKKLRDQLHFDDKYIIGHVGRFTEQKNHEFLIRLFQSIHQDYPNTILLLVGTGPLEEQERRLVSELNLENSVYFCGVREDVNDLYQIMDVFVLPSIFEGLGIVNIEAQTSGLKCVVSDAVPHSVNITGNVTFLSLNDEYKTWEHELMTSLDKRLDQSYKVIAAGYDIKQSAKILERLYMETAK